MGPVVSFLGFLQDPGRPIRQPEPPVVPLADRSDPLRDLVQSKVVVDFHQVSIGPGLVGRLHNTIGLLQDSLDNLFAADTAEAADLEYVLDRQSLGLRDPGSSSGAPDGALSAELASDPGLGCRACCWTCAASLLGGATLSPSEEACQPATAKTTTPTSAVTSTSPLVISCTPFLLPGACLRLGG